MSMIELKAPPFRALAGEFLTPLELPRLLAASPALVQQPRGSGEPVIVLPGLAASNASTVLMRGYLSWLGYSVEGWTEGRNTGDVRGLLPPVIQQVQQLHGQSDSQVNIVGWSLGGVIAREVARGYPDIVRQIVTMGSPVVGGPKYTSFGRMYEQRGADLDQIEARLAERENQPIDVPVTSIYSKRDGIVGWQASIDRHTPQVEHREVSATHLGLGISAEVFIILAQKLAQA